MKQDKATKSGVALTIGDESVPVRGSTRNRFNGVDLDLRCGRQDQGKRDSMLAKGSSQKTVDP